MMGYWHNRYTGEYVESRKKPGGNYANYWQPADQGYIDKMQQKERETTGIAALKEAVGLFDEDYGKGIEAKARASAVSQAITSGLGGTTRPGAISAGFSAEIEDMRRGRLFDALSNMSNFLGSYRDPFAITPQVNLGYQQLGEQKRQANEGMKFNYRQLNQQNRQFFAGLNASRGRPIGSGLMGDSRGGVNNVSTGGSIWDQTALNYSAPEPGYADSMDAFMRQAQILQEHA